MRKFLYLLFTLCFFISFQAKTFAIEEDIPESIQNSEQEEDITEVLQNTPQDDEITLIEEDGTVAEEEPEQKQLIEDKLVRKNNETDTLFDKVLYSKIIRTDIASYLFKDELTFNYDKGPISSFELSGAYRGSINSLWKNSQYTTKYENMATKIETTTSFRNPDYKLKLSVQPIPVQGNDYLSNFISDLYVLNTSIPHHQISFGRSRVQVGYEGGASTWVLPFYSRSQIARNFGNVRSTNAKIIGVYQYLDYNLSVGSSSRELTGGFPGAEFNVWLNAKPFGNKTDKYGRLNIGVGYTGGHYQSNYSILSSYIGYKYKKLWTNFEVGLADGYNGQYGYNDKKALGYAYTLGWKFNPHLQLIGRIDQFDPDRDISNNLKREYTIGLNWFIKGQALKLILNYVFCHNQNMPNSQKIILATQILI